MPSVRSKRTEGGPHVRLQGPHLSKKQIVAWAKAHFARFGRYPSANTGPVLGAPGETWLGIYSALYSGGRGLRGGETLPTFLRRTVGKMRRTQKSVLTVHQIVAWARAHHARTGRWPSVYSGRVVGATGETWAAINSAMEHGYRGLPRSGSLSKLMDGIAGPNRRLKLPPLTAHEILAWARVYRKRTSSWPNLRSGPISGTRETWRKVDSALKAGQRGLQGNDSLSRLLSREAGKPMKKPSVLASHTQILKWADAYHRRHGHWPYRSSGQVGGPGALKGITWDQIDRGLRFGWRGRSAPSLAKLLRAKRGESGHGMHPPFKLRSIVAAARDFRRRTGGWPQPGSPDQVSSWHWSTIRRALFAGQVPGIPAGTRLPAFFAERCAAPYQTQSRSPLSIREILNWADRHRERTGRWPKRGSGAIVGVAKDITWSKVDSALFRGGRGLSREKGLAQLLLERRGVHHWYFPPPMSVKQILSWAVAFNKRGGRWPSKSSGMVREAPQESWSRINHALVQGRRGLRGQGRSLSHLIDTMRGTPSDVAKKRTLRLQDVMLWAKAHARRTGSWPEKYDGRVTDAKGETWFGIDEALRAGLRGLPKVKSLGLLFSGLPRPRVLALGRR